MGSADSLRFGVPACALCERHEVQWVHTLDWELATFRVYGKGHVWGSPISVCESCHDHLAAKDVEALVAVDSREDIVSALDIEEQVRNGIRALITADLGGVPVDDTRPQGYRELVEQGFLPLEQLTGEWRIATVWPDEHRRGLREPDAEFAAELELPDGQYWFVRSPWESVPLEALFDLIIDDMLRADDELAAAQAIFDSGAATIRKRLRL